MTIKITVTHDEPGSTRTISICRSLVNKQGESLPQGPVIELSAGQSESFNIWGDVYVVVAETPLQEQLNPEGAMQ